MALEETFHKVGQVDNSSINTKNEENQHKLEPIRNDSCTEKSLNLEVYLPEFFIWLEEKIKLANFQFILGYTQSKPPKSHPHSDKKLIFLLAELLEQYSDCSGVAANVIHRALKQALSINFSYTVERDNQIIEVTPCLYPLCHNLDDNRLFTS